MRGKRVVVWLIYPGSRRPRLRAVTHFGVQARAMPVDDCVPTFDVFRSEGQPVEVFLHDISSHQTLSRSKPIRNLRACHSSSMRRKYPNSLYLYAEGSVLGSHGRRSSVAYIS